MYKNHQNNVSNILTGEISLSFYPWQKWMGEHLDYLMNLLKSWADKASNGGA